VGVSGDKGELSVGGMNFSIPEHPARLLQQAFVAMKESTVLHKQETEVMLLDKGKDVPVTEPTVQHPKVPTGADEPESSKQAEVRGRGQ
jgi:hypothetical protein